MVHIAPSTTSVRPLVRPAPREAPSRRVESEPRMVEPRMVEPRDSFERTPAKARGQTDKPPKANKDKAALDNLAFINELAAEARKLKTELSASDANVTIDDQSTSENMSPKQFKLFSRSSKFSSQVLGKAFQHARKHGLGGEDDPRLSPEERTRLSELKEGLKRSLLRSKDSSLTAGERHQASQEVAERVIELQEFAHAKAASVVVTEGKKALDEAGKFFGGLFSKGEEKELEKAGRALERSNQQDASDKRQKLGPGLLEKELKKRSERERLEKNAQALEAYSDAARAGADAFRAEFAETYPPASGQRRPIEIVTFVPPAPVYTPGLIRGGQAPVVPAPSLPEPTSSPPSVGEPPRTPPPERRPELIA